MESYQYSDVMGSLNPRVRKRVEALKEIQSQHDELEAKFSEHRAALEAKYQQLYESLYTKRYDIVNGAVEVDVFPNLQSYDSYGVVEVEGSTNENAEGTPAEGAATEEKGIPDFWLTAMKTNELLAEEIQERDEEALKFLKDIKWCKIDNPKGFKLEFLFNANPFFKNSALTKIFHIIDEKVPIIEQMIGTEIEWLTEKRLNLELMGKRQRKGSYTRPITLDCDSFFDFFNPPRVLEAGDEYEYTLRDLQDEMKEDYDIGSTIRDKIIPHAVSWFTGEGEAFPEDNYGRSKDDEDEYEDWEEDEDEDEDEEEESKTKRMKSEVDGTQAGHFPECKQQ